MKQLDFSVVVPFFNNQQFIERCARALLSQTWPADRYEVLMVDNNSTDRSASIAAGFERIRLLHETQQGSYAARNRGIREARGAIVAFTDADCEPDADWLEQISLAMENPYTALVLGDRRFATDSGILGMLAAYETRLVARIFAERQTDCCFAYTNNMAARMSVVRAIGGFRTFRRGADSLFMRNVVKQHGIAAVQYCERVRVRHLEISGVGDYLDKKSTYGKVNSNRELATPAALPLRSRLELALLVRRQSATSFVDTVALLGVLTAGAIRFKLGRQMKGALRHAAAWRG